MKIRNLAVAITVTLASAARATSPAPSYAAISLVGDKLDIVTYQPQVGTQLDSNSHMPLVLSADELDTAALRAINRAVKQAVPGASVALLAASTPDSFENQDRIFHGDHVVLPAEIDAAVRREGATMLVLVTKRHAEARLQTVQGFIGSGKLDGLGYYMDTIRHVKSEDTQARSVGYLAPYVYVDVSLVDLATSTVVRRGSITSGYIIGSANKAGVVNPWDALDAKEKVDTLKSLLTRQLMATVPSVVTGEAPHKAE